MAADRTAVPIRARRLCSGYESAPEAVSISYVVTPILENQWPAIRTDSGDCRMAHFLASDEKYRELIYDDDYRAYLTARSAAPGSYRFGSGRGRRARVHARGASRRVKGYFKSMIEAIARAKLRRMERELELRGIRLSWERQSRSVKRS
jgi:hypothetical protein